MLALFTSLTFSVDSLRRCRLCVTQVLVDNFRRVKRRTAPTASRRQILSLTARTIQVLVSSWQTRQEDRKKEDFARSVATARSSSPLRRFGRGTWATAPKLPSCPQLICLTNFCFANNVGLPPECRSIVLYPKKLHVLVFESWLQYGTKHPTILKRRCHIEPEVLLLGI